MSKKTLALLAFVAALTVAACSSTGSGPSGTAGSSGFLPQARSGQSKIQHVVFIVQENRSFDNFFDCFPGTDCVKQAPGPGPQPGPTTGASPCPNPLSTPTPGPTPTPIQIALNAKLPDLDIDHTYCSAFVTEYDNGRMDGFYWAGFVQPGVPAETYPYQVVSSKKIQPYWDLARQYVLADRTFATQASGSFTAHQDLIRGDTFIDSTHAVVDYPWNIHNVSDWGCDDASGSVTSLLKTSNNPAALQYLPRQGPFPCFTYATARDLLDAKGISWKYYAPVWGMDGGQEWNAFDAIHAVRSDKSEWPNKRAPFNCTNSCVSWPETNVLCDIAGSTASPCPKPSPSGSLVLPAVSWVIPDSEDSDHTDGKGTDNGPDWVASVVNAIGESSYWKSTAIVIVWDDWGGFYDHIPPPQLDYEGLGFRVPMIIVSPYAKRGYVSHTQYEFGSLLKFVEDTYSLGNLGTTDVRANSISDSFNFNQPPHRFTPIKLLNANHDRRYFLRRPPSNEPVDTQ